MKKMGNFAIFTFDESKALQETSCYLWVLLFEKCMVDIELKWTRRRTDHKLHAFKNNFTRKLEMFEHFKKFHNLLINYLS